MKKLLLLLLISISCNSPIDIRNEYLKKGTTKNDLIKGQELLDKMEKAYGGRDNWENNQYGEFTQIADWYGRLMISNWDVVPQKFKLKCELATNNSEMTLINGKNKGKKYWIENNKYYEKRLSGKKKQTEKNHYHEKMIFKNYWFQFPFKIREASIICYAGKEKIKEQEYNIVYATWGTKKANDKYDQFLLYLNTKTNRIDKLYFTVREKFNKITLTAEFKNFKLVNKNILPFSQYVRYGNPHNDGIKFHENHYQEIVLK